MNRKCPKCHAGESMPDCDLCGGRGHVTQSVSLMWIGATSTVKLDTRKIEELQARSIPSEPPTIPRREDPNPLAVIERADRARRVWLFALALLAVGLLALLSRAMVTAG